jgi:hypothetical protein
MGGLVYDILRVIVVHVRLVADNPAAWLPAACLIAAAWVAWAASRPGGALVHDRLVTVLVFATSAVTLAWFVQFGRLSWSGTSDWVKDWTYYSALQQAVLRGELPYYLRTSLQQTDRYLANLETFAAPHAILLAWLSIRSFFLLHLLTVFAIGFAGLVALKRELSLSAIAWLMFVIVFLLNGHTTAHLSVGHTQWAGYFLIPWVLVAVVRVAKDDCGTSNAALLGLTLSVMIAVGAWHVSVACVLLAILVGLTRRCGVGFLGSVAAMTSALSAFRLLPAFITFGGGENQFLASFTSVGLLYDGLLGETSTVVDGIAAHEYDLYVGHIGLALVGLGLIPARRASLRFSNVVLLASAVLLALAMYGIYEATLFRLPGFVSQRVAARFAVLPLLVVVLTGCLKLDAWGLAPHRAVSAVWVASLPMAMFLVIQLVVRASGWRPAASEVPPVPVDALKYEAPEFAYGAAVIIGFVISGLAVVGLALFWRYRRRSVPESVAAP